MMWFIFHAMDYFYYNDWFTKEQGDMSERTERIARTALEILGEALPRMLEEDLYPLITLTGAEVSSDLSFIDVRVLGGAGNRSTDEVFAHFLKYRHQLQGLIARGLRSRKTPKLRLHLDKSLDYSEKIGDLLHEIHGEHETEE
jgi:ribosome-binding factor A